MRFHKYLRINKQGIVDSGIWNIIHDEYFNGNTTSIGILPFLQKGQCFQANTISTCVNIWSNYISSCKCVCVTNTTWTFVISRIFLFTYITLPSLIPHTHPTRCRPSVFLQISSFWKQLWMIGGGLINRKSSLNVTAVLLKVSKLWHVCKIVAGGWVNYNKEISVNFQTPFYRPCQWVIPLIHWPWGIWLHSQISKFEILFNDKYLN